MDIKDRVIKIIAEQAVLEPSDVTMDSTLEDLGIDSLGLVESIFAIEEESGKAEVRPAERRKSPGY